MSKILYGKLDERNQIDVPLKIATNMSDIFRQYQLAQPLFARLSEDRTFKTVIAQRQSNEKPSNPSTNLFSQPQDASEPSALVSQNAEVTRKK